MTLNEAKRAGQARALEINDIVRIAAWQNASLKSPTPTYRMIKR